MFSVPGLLLKLNKFYQDVAELKRLRYVTTYLTPEVVQLRGDGEAIENAIRYALGHAFDDAISGTIQLNVTYDASNLYVTISNPENHVSYGEQRFEVSFFKEDQSIENDMVMKWQMNDIEMSDLLIHVIQSIIDKKQLMNQAIESQDLHKLKTLIHGAKGVTGSYKMEEFFRLFCELDEYLKVNPNISLSSDKQIIQYFKSIEEVINKIPKHYL